MKQNLVLVTTSPLAKIFQPRFRVKAADGTETIVKRESLLNDPSRVFRDEVFSVQFVTTTGPIQFWSGIPKPIQDEAQKRVILGGADIFESAESDDTGIVSLELETDALSAIFSLAAGGTTDKGLKDMMKHAMTKAREASKERCMNQCRRMYRNMRAQMQLIEESGKGKYIPSPAERLVAYVLEKEMTQEIARQRQHEKEFDDTMARITSAGEKNAGHLSI